MRIKIGHGEMTAGYLWPSRDGTILRMKAFRAKQQAEFERDVATYRAFYRAQERRDQSPAEFINTLLHHWRGYNWAEPVRRKHTRVLADAMANAPATYLIEQLDERIAAVYGFTMPHATVRKQQVGA